MPVTKVSAEDKFKFADIGMELHKSLAIHGYWITCPVKKSVKFHTGEHDAARQ